MDTIDYSYPPGGGTQVDTTAAPRDRGTVDPGLLALMQTMSARRQRRPPVPLGPGGPSIQGPNFREQQAGRAELGARTAAAQASAEASRAMSGPAPMKVIGGPGIIPGLTMDVNKMTGAQRKVFLPGGSSFSGPSLDQMDAHNEGSLDRFSDEMSRRRAATQGGYTHVGAANAME